MSIAVVAGTTAELIKLAPVLKGINERGGSYQLWNTAQHVGSYATTLSDFGLAPSDLHLIPEDVQRQLVASRQVPGWALRLGKTAIRERRALRARLQSCFWPTPCCFGMRPGSFGRFLFLGYCCRSLVWRACSCAGR